MDTSLQSLINGVQATSHSLDEAGRKTLFNALQRLSWSIESPFDAMQRIAYSQLTLHSIKVGVDMKLFEALASSDKPLTTEDLQQKTGASYDIVDRYCRHLAGIGALSEPGEHCWQANELTKTLTIPGWASLISHNHDLVGPICQVAPAWLKERNYAPIDNALDTPFHKAFDFQGLLFTWFQQQPVPMSNFMQFMMIQRGSQPKCFDTYPIKQKAEGLRADQAFFVDIGGNAGHQAVAVRELLPQLPNKIVNEDLEQTLAIGIQHPGIEHLAQDFFQPQAIEGARVYYLRNVLHDWSDELSTKILSNTREAMADPESVILIDEIVLPESKVAWQASQVDLEMMLCLAAKERSIEQWKKVIANAGLKIKKIYTYTLSFNDSIIECVPA
ncbi:hypothetical protein AMS68_005371 [Peltaster fructicola]|uniref:Uncharacterized protein n=1 Tax=Peltaster fructicola TaxID=286661 RepID=A0A6H0XYM8_9PEZI|nr:hypothetical protein AMS68_005371 [Peltaster fructicola]